MKRLLPVVAVVAALLAGCGAAPAAPPAATRTVTDLLGPVDVPVAPQRVAVVWSRGLPEIVAELGAPVVGATTDQGTLSPLIDPVLAAGITSLGETAEPDIEQVAAVDPDLILAFDLTVEGATLEKYREIAPVFVIDGTNLFSTPWRDVVRTVAVAVGREAEADRLIADLDARIAALRPQLEQRYAGSTVGIAAAFGDQDVGLVSPVHPAGAVLAELGLARPPGHDVTEPTVSLSAEELPTVDADHLFYFYWGYTGDPVALTGNPLWPTLRAVAAGHAHEVDGQAWTVPVPAAIRIMLDDVERALL